MAKQPLKRTIPFAKRVLNKTKESVPKRKALNLFLPEQMNIRLKEVCEAENIMVSRLLESLIGDFLESYDVEHLVGLGAKVSRALAHKIKDKGNK